MTSRRDFLKVALASSAVLVSAACGPPRPRRPRPRPRERRPADRAGRETHRRRGARQPPGRQRLAAPVEPLHPHADPFFKLQADDWGKQTGVNLSVETVNANDLTARFTPPFRASPVPRSSRCSTWPRTPSPRAV